MANVDWTALDNIYHFQRLWLTELKLPSALELTAYKVGPHPQTGPLRGLEQAVQWEEERVFPGSEIWIARIQKFNTDLASGIDLDTSEHRQLNRSCYDVIEEAISSKTFTTELVLAWAHLGHLVGRRTELLEWAKGIEQQFRQQQNAAVGQRLLAQKFWYAMWVARHTGGSEAKLADVQIYFAELCSAIVRGSKVAPSRFRKEWFNPIIRLETPQNGSTRVPAKGTTKPVEIAPNFLKLSMGALRALATEGELHSPDLPPIEKSAYRKA